jgi:dTDP-4-amino-4,6-dideoxy-D-galactose acyltransferase
MVKELIWDSAFFKRKIGELELTFRTSSRLRVSLDKARSQGFKYVTCKMTSQHTSLIKLLQSLGFYLTDIGVIFTMETDRYWSHSHKKYSAIRKFIRAAEAEDAPVLKKVAKSLFRESRFYNDPFFSKEEADRLYQSWVENSVKGQAADVVFHIPNTGFITCRKSGKGSGEIVLLGTRKSLRGRGFGAALVCEAMRWFREERIDRVSVRTQLKNMRAVNFYAGLGFRLRKYDLIFGKIL